MNTDKLLQQIKGLLQFAFGNRLCGVVLYGSEARGDPREDSDIDILMLLEGPIHLGQEIDTATRALYPLMLETERIIDAKPADIRNYEAGNTPLYRNAKREGILI